MNTVRALGLALALACISACTPRASYPPPAPYPAPEEPVPEQPPGQPQTPEGPQTPEQPPYDNAPPPASTAPRSAAQISGPAVLALMQRAEQHASAGDLDSAAASLERALDLEPRNPFVYQRLASLRLEQGQASQAETLARKSNSLAGDNPYIKSENWRIIAQTRSIRGDTVGASSASGRASYYQTRTHAPQ